MFHGLLVVVEHRDPVVLRIRYVAPKEVVNGEELGKSGRSAVQVEVPSLLPMSPLVEMMVSPRKPNSLNSVLRRSVSEGNIYSSGSP